MNNVQRRSHGRLKPAAGHIPEGSTFDQAVDMGLAAYAPEVSAASAELSLVGPGYHFCPGHELREHQSESIYAASNGLSVPARCAYRSVVVTLACPKTLDSS